jgi:kynureninase
LHGRRVDDGRSAPRFPPEFPIVEKTTYLISNSLGAMPRAAADALAEYANTWATRGVRAWEALDESGKLRHLTAG